MQVERPMLVEHFRGFVAGGSGVIVGAPGVGKTYLLKEYCAARLDAKEPCLYLPIDKIGAQSESELLAELGIGTTFTAYLRSQENDSDQAVLAVDAFDAARSEYAQSFVIGLIRRAQEELGDHWKIIVSVRSYDAKHSITLQALFPDLSQSEIPKHYQARDIECRHFAIPLLSETETQAAVSSVSGLDSIYDTASTDFRELMRVPFNIWLGESLLSGDVVPSDLSSVASESQLLGLYWRHRVTQVPRASELSAILSRITERMVADHSLSAPISDVYPVGAHDTWNMLLSSELLEEVRPQRQRVAYSHNILFDYAVSVLLIDRDPTAACAFLAEDLSRPLFLRPSIDYFFTRLWDSDPEGFWKVLWYMLDTPETHVRVYARLVPAMVAAREARMVEQFAPLLDRNAEHDATGATFLLHLFQAVRGLFKGQRDALWAELTSQACSHIQGSFAWELAALTFDILEAAIEDECEDIAELCAGTGRRILEWALHTRTESHSAFPDKVGSIWGVRLVSRTFRHDGKASRALLESILKQVGEPNFPIEYLSRLTNELPHLWPLDPELAVEVYTRTFGHEERSDSPTDFGTPVLPMSSTRRQDFSMCQYHLKQHYAAFLNASLLAATRAALHSLNDHVIREEVVRYLNPGYSVADLTDTFMFRGHTATYIRDLSYNWDAGGQPDGATSLGDQLFQRMEQLARDGDEHLVGSLLDLFAREATVAYWWKRLLEMGSRVPSALAQPLFSLVVARPVLRNLETLHAAGLFIEKATRHLSKAQREELEHLIVAQLDNDDDGETYTDRRDRLLACFPHELLSTDDGQRLRAELEAGESLPKNEPLVRMSFSSRPYSEDDWLEEKGADVELPDNQTLLMATGPSSEFASKWRNDRPSSEAIADFVPALKAGLDAIMTPSSADVAVLQDAWTKLSESAEAIAKGLDTADGEAFGLVKTILLTGLQRDPAPARDPNADESYTFASWSPSPATTAAQGLPWLARLVADEDILGTFEALAADARPEVRFLAAQESLRFIGTAPEVFWHIVGTRAVGERSPAVQDAICRTVGYVFFSDVDRAAKTLSTLTQRVLVPRRKSDALKTLTSIALSLTLRDEPHDWGVSVTTKVLERPTDYSHALAHAVFETASQLTPVDVGSVDDELLTRRIDWLSKAVTSAVTGLRDVLPRTTEPPNDNSTDLLKTLYGVLDEVVIRLYFSVKSKRTDTGLSGQGNGTAVQRAQYFERTKPLLEQILAFANEPKKGILFAPTAHHFMKLLREVLDYDPRGVLRLAAAVAVASERGGYHLDSMAADEAVYLAERIITDYRSELRHADSLSSLVTLLDLFAKVGWPGALRLLWSLDKIFR